jgi:hypothetical protein
MNGVSSYSEETTADKSIGDDTEFVNCRSVGSLGDCSNGNVIIETDDSRKKSYRFLRLWMQKNSSTPTPSLLTALVLLGHLQYLFAVS